MAADQYDEPGFFAAYAGLPRSVQGLDGAPEWPAMRSLLPSVDAADVLDLGCGYGWFGRWAAAQGARTVLGIDGSERMLERARAADSVGGLSYRLADIETLELEAASFDLVYSSLSLHYLHDLRAVLGNVATWLRPGGRFVCSVEHPIYTAPRAPLFIAGPEGTDVWALDGYLHEGPRVVNWLGGEVSKYHRTIATHLDALASAGLTLTDLVEWGPTAEQLADHPEWANELARPMFLLLGADLV